MARKTTQTLPTNPPTGAQELVLKDAFTSPQPAGEEDLVRRQRCIDRDVQTSCQTHPRSELSFLAVELESEALVNTVTVYYDHIFSTCSDIGCVHKIKVTSGLFGLTSKVTTYPQGFCESWLSAEDGPMV